MKRSEVYWSRLDPVEGSEYGKTRPCVIVSMDVLNASLPTVVVCPLTTVLRPSWRSRLQVTVAGKRADVCADQIRTISKTWLEKRMGTLSKRDSEALQRLLREMYA